MIGEIHWLIFGIYLGEKNNQEQLEMIYYDFIKLTGYELRLMTPEVKLEPKKMYVTFEKENTTINLIVAWENIKVALPISL